MTANIKRASLLVAITFIVQVCVAHGETSISCGAGLTCPVTEYPVDVLHMKDHLTQAKVGYPAEQVKGGTIWVKGSENYSNVRLILERTEEVVDQTNLSSSYDVHIFEDLPTEEDYIVEFNSNDNSGSRIHSVRTVSRDSLNSALRSRQYSMAFYGCFQPFTINDSGKSSLYSPSHNPNFPFKFLDYFNKVALGKSQSQIDGHLPNTRFIVGTGDQVYMDAGYEGEPSTRKNDHQLSAWTTDEAVPILKRIRSDQDGSQSGFGSFKDHVEKTYRAFGSFQKMNQIFSQIPQVNAWDDHEIRDGWGSHGDEYENGKLSSLHASVFEDARAGYVAHQLLAGPSRKQLNIANDGRFDSSAAENKSLHQTFSLGKYEGFVLDLRSNRNKLRKSEPVLGVEQKSAFRNWLQEQVEKDESQHILIVSSMPIFLKNNKIVESVVSLQSGLRDDLTDGWHSDENEADRIWLMKLLMSARLNGVRPVFVSGDYHKGAISEIWFGKEKNGACTRAGEHTKRIFGYEILASGLFHEGLAKGLIGKAFDRAESQRVGEHMERHLEVEAEKYCIDPHVEVSVVRENFGGLVINDHDQNMADQLKLFAGDDKSNIATTFSLDMNWEKGFVSKNEKKYVGFWKFWSRLPLTKDTFIPVGIQRDESMDICLSDFEKKGSGECKVN